MRFRNCEMQLTPTRENFGGQPVVSEEPEAYEVSTKVNSPENDSPECVRRILNN